MPRPRGSAYDRGLWRRARLPRAGILCRNWGGSWPPRRTPPTRGADRTTAGRNPDPLRLHGGAGAQPLPAPTQDLDARLIADATSQGGSAIVPSAHEVLVVDDEVVVLTVLRELLRRSGYRVTTAASAEEAIDLMHKRSLRSRAHRQEPAGRLRPRGLARRAHPRSSTRGGDDHRVLFL